MTVQHIYKQIDTYKTILYAWFESMHTRIDLILCDQTETISLKTAERILNETKRIEKLGNRFDPESEISLINRLASNAPLKITSEAFSILSACIAYNRKTAGVFDITINSKNKYQSGISDIILHAPDQTVFFTNPNVQLDLSGYLKGYALDRIKVILEEDHFSDALINIGNSSVFAMGNHPYGKGWKVKTCFPHSSIENKETCLCDEFLTTSGNDSQERKHIIDPLTGKYIEGIKEVSIITATGELGEVVSTSLIVNPRIKAKPGLDFCIL